MVQIVFWFLVPSRSVWYSIPQESRSSCAARCLLLHQFSVSRVQNSIHAPHVEHNARRGELTRREIPSPLTNVKSSSEFFHSDSAAGAHRPGTREIYQQFSVFTPNSLVLSRAEITGHA